MNKETFINNIAAAVIKIAPEFGIKVYSPIIAQACLECGYGTSNKAKYNNFFGLKYRKDRLTCHSGTFEDGSSEQLENGEYIAIVDQWYKFNTLEDGVRGYFQFINTPRYENLKGITDPLKYLETIKADGYATSHDYVKNVYNTLKNNNLERFDSKGAETMKTLKIHLDPGHYGSKYNQSTTNKKYYESNMNWELVGYLKNELEAKGATVTTSRQNKDDNPSLYNRGYGAKGCDLFLSIHSNACGTESVDRPVVIALLDDKRYDFDDTSRDIGAKFATLIEETMQTKDKGRLITKKSDNDRDGDGLHNDEYYGVLNGAKAAKVPGLILEHSFHTNARATEWLLNSDNLKLIAKKEAELITSYFNLEEKPEEPKPAQPTEPEQPQKTQWYRVRKTWEDKKSQTGAYKILENAKKNCGEGYSVFDENGNVIYTNKKEEVKPVAPQPKPEPTPEYTTGKYKIKVDALNYRKGPGTEYGINGTIKDKGIYTIIEVKNTHWGRLKSGAGWISIHKNYAEKVGNITENVAPKNELKVGDKVKLKPNATVYGRSTKYQSWVYNATLYVREIAGDRVVISTLQSGAVTGSVHKDQLTKI